MCHTSVDQMQICGCCVSPLHNLSPSACLPDMFAQQSWQSVSVLSKMSAKQQQQSVRASPSSLTMQGRRRRRGNYVSTIVIYDLSPVYCLGIWLSGTTVAKNCVDDGRSSYPDWAINQTMYWGADQFLMASLDWKESNGGGGRLAFDVLLFFLWRRLLFLLFLTATASWPYGPKYGQKEIASFSAHLLLSVRSSNTFEYICWWA